MSGIEDFLTWIPAVSFPLSHLVQIFKMLRAKEVGGLSVVTFAMYFFGNMGAYLFAAKYLDPRTLLSFVLTGILEIVIVSLAFHFSGNKTGLILTLVIGLIVGVGELVTVLTQKKKLKKISDGAGYFPAVLFPLATLFQLFKIIEKRSVVGVSCAGWTLQILANIGAYVLIGKWANFKNIGAFLGTGVVDIMIVIFYLRYGGDAFGCIPGVGEVIKK